MEGVEISPEQAQIARQVTPHIHQQDVLAYLKARQGSLELITALDLIEHFRKDEVLEFLDLCYQALTTGGRLILQTPNAASPWCSAIRYGDFTYEVCFTPSLLKSLLQMLGYRNIEAREQGPVPKGNGCKNTVRYYLWRGFGAAMSLWSLVECGSPGETVRTRVFIASAVK